MRRSVDRQPVSRMISFLVFAGTLSSGSCIVVETGPPGAWNGPAMTEEERIEQEQDGLE